MITLKTLPEATAQEVFEQIVTHCLTQGERSELLVPDGFDGNHNQRYTHYCQYRGDKGNKCAAGCLMSDKEYRKNWEQKGWCELVMDGDVPSNHMELIAELQYVHDRTKACDWLEAFIQVANRFGLNTAFLETWNEKDELKGS